MTDHETTLRKIADDIAENLATYPKHSSQVPVLVREMENLARERAACLAGADALRAALGTCGTCAHADERETGADGWTSCAAPSAMDRFPFAHKRMPLDERCTGWTPRTDE